MFIQILRSLYRPLLWHSSNAILYALSCIDIIPSCLFLKSFISTLRRMNGSGSKQWVHVATRQPSLSLLKNIHSAFFVLAWHCSKCHGVERSFLLVCLPLQWLRLVWSLQLCTHWWPIPGFYHHVHCANCILLEVAPTRRLESHTSSCSICKYLATLASKQ